MAADTIPARLLNQERTRPDAPAYHVREGGTWKPTSWGQYVGGVRGAGKALMALGLEPGQSTCILGYNRPEWTIMDLATMCAGGAPAGIYTTCSPEEVAYIVGHTEASVVLVEDHGQWEKLKATRDGLPNLKHIVLMGGADPVDDEMVLTWDEFIERGSGVPDSDFQDRIEALDPKALATLIYTSGTTGPPKGVMLSHENLAWTAEAAIRLVGASHEDCSLSYLPLSHIAEQMFSLHVPVTTGACIYFAESIDRVPDNLREVCPTLLFGVPRIWEKMYSKVQEAAAQSKGLKKKIAGWAKRVGAEVNDLKNRGVEPTGMLKIKYDLACSLVFSKVKPKMGLTRARVCVSGAAPISAEILEYFSGLDIVIREVYGQSEDTGPTTFNVPGRTRYGTVGPAVPGVEVKIAEDEEILVRGPNVFMGYYKEPDATAETLIDGWLHSGDLGRFDSDGFLSITGRKKDIIITAGGKNVAPKNWEGDVKNMPVVGEAVMIGDKRKFLSALISLDPDAAAAWASTHGADAATLQDNAQLRDELQAWIDKANSRYARVEQVKKFTVLPRPLSIDDGELTPTLKVKRNRVSEHFAELIEAMYEGT